MKTDGPNSGSRLLKLLQENLESGFIEEVASWLKSSHVLEISIRSSPLLSNPKADPNKPELFTNGLTLVYLSLIIFQK